MIASAERITSYELAKKKVKIKRLDSCAICARHQTFHIYSAVALSELSNAVWLLFVSLLNPARRNRNRIDHQHCHCVKWFCAASTATEPKAHACNPFIYTEYKNGQAKLSDSRWITCFFSLLWFAQYISSIWFYAAAKFSAQVSQSQLCILSFAHASARWIYALVTEVCAARSLFLK